MKVPYYDASTDTIHGCEEGTLTYFHEKGHQAWARRGIEQQFQLIQSVIILVMLPIAVSLAKNIILTLLACIPVLLYLISETHAEIYGFIHLLKNKKERNEIQ